MVTTYPPIAQPAAFRSTANLTHRFPNTTVTPSMQCFNRGRPFQPHTREDLADAVAPAFAHLRFPPGGLFVRLDDCSPKDGGQTIPGRKSLHTIDDIILRIVTSSRCQVALEVWVKGQGPVELFFLPFDGRMAAEREYRVFCRPKDCRVTGISQYRWHKPWKFSKRSGLEQDQHIEMICKGSQIIRDSIMANLEQTDPTDGLMQD
ncbi:hypothetical protein CFIO01_11833 [Colletotrichum fioriniae PJ7]|uniref:Uncharacterized protein n=1 Tax=Colletotrichum fioriniae PJ7 TaxID=1445577 RepID=A0A010R8B5_9PEZI|nr:hypothetical protein CFIO01_11833 [Colletotrichum fioriniae PJ7]